MLEIIVMVLRKGFEEAEFLLWGKFDYVRVLVFDI
jgi:hypothetical protein